ncbi:UNVERIFIED_CONTAM: hypothetical protein DES50_12121 [Williamsia faeni]
MTDLMELFRHWHGGRSQVQIAAALGIGRKTIRKYLAPAIAAGITPGAERFDESVWRELITGWFLEVADPAVRAVTRPAIAVHHDWIKEQLGESVTVATIAQRLRDDHGVGVSESSVRRYVTTAFAEQFAEGKARCRVVRSRPAMRRRSITANWACGMTRSPIGGSRSGRSR